MPERELCGELCKVVNCVVTKPRPNRMEYDAARMILERKYGDDASCAWA